ncbi:MAG: monovalent cation/H+ antiporter complex subunit F [Nitrospirales bacterium]
MSNWYLGLEIFLVLNLIAGLVRIHRGPTPADSMLAVQLFGTTSVAILILFAQALNRPALRDVALIFALLATVSTVAFVRRVWGGAADEDQEERQ